MTQSLLVYPVHLGNSPRLAGVLLSWGPGHSVQGAQSHLKGNLSRNMQGGVVASPGGLDETFGQVPFRQLTNRSLDPFGQDLYQALESLGLSWGTREASLLHAYRFGDGEGVWVWKGV